MKKAFVVVLFLTGLPLAAAAGSFLDGSFYRTELRFTPGGSRYTPFWLTANQHGLASFEPNNGYLRAGLFRPVAPERRFSYGYGLDLAVAWNFPSVFYLQQAYVWLKYRSLGLIVGSKEYPPELKNPALTGGGLTHSGNARPVPQVRLGIPDYTPFPGTRRWLHVKGVIAYGWFSDGDFQHDRFGPGGKWAENVLYHYKSLFLKLEHPSFPLTAVAGVEMAAQFGGTLHLNGQTIRMPHGIAEYFKAFVPLGGGKDAPVTEQRNVNGNHAGSWHFSLGYRFRNWNVRAYYEHFFEDHSMMFWQYPWIDGLVGVELTPPPNPFVTSFVYEYLGTKDQAGPVYHDATSDIPVQASAVDDYYNHVLYPGWQHAGLGMGSPFLLSPLYNEDRRLLFKGNRTKAHHFGIAGDPAPNWSYRLLFSAFRSWGTYAAPFRQIKECYSGLAEIQYALPVPGLTLSGAFAWDSGSWIGNNFGGMISLRKTGLFHLPRLKKKQP